MIFPAVWRPGEPVKALCALGHAVPCGKGEHIRLGMFGPHARYRYHVCGVHAFNSRAHATEYAVRHLKTSPAALFVVGKVAGAGRTVEHEMGWRSARAAILSLDQLVTSRDVGNVGHDLLTQLRRRYRLALTLEVR